MSEEARGTVAAWLVALFDAEDAVELWELTAGNLRLACAQTVHRPRRKVSRAKDASYRDRAIEVAVSGPDHADWDPFAGRLLVALQASYELLRPPDRRHFSRANPEGPGLELVLVAPERPTEGSWHAERGAIVAPFLLELTRGTWLVTGFSNQPATPGWPPDFHRERVDWT